MLTLAQRIPSIILASGSTARKAILLQQGIQVTVCPTYCDEQGATGNAQTVVGTLALRKMQAYRDKEKTDRPVLTCDTMVRFEDHLIGKAADEEEAYAQLSAFAGKKQDVYTGWALLLEGKLFKGTDHASVWFKKFSPNFLVSYVKTGEWKGAAGSYRIQGKGKALISRIEGDVFTVAGLPLLQISAILGVTVSDGDDTEFPPLRG